MLKFSDLQFEKQPTILDEEFIQARQFFSNGYGVSVVRHPGSYGYREGLYELAVLQGTEDDYELCYNTHITDDVIGHLDETSVENIINEVNSL